MFRSKRVIFGILFGTIVAGRCYHPIVAEVDNMIKKELPVGSNQSQVIAFLKARKMEYVYNEKEKTIYSGFRNLPFGGWRAAGPPHARRRRRR